ncbi:MAG: bacterial Ig-like domain-containing protein [Bacilli bacterium]|nr:bacterial Ig-like domain-containing protein [Bacilli bacterium]
MKKMTSKHKFIFLSILILLLLSSSLFFTRIKKKSSSDVQVLGKTLVLDATQNQVVELKVGVDLFTGNSEQNRKNNTVNLQNAIDAVSNSGGGTVVIPEGSFYFTQGGLAITDSGDPHEKYVIKPRNNVLLKGKGSNKTILYPVENNQQILGTTETNCDNVSTTTFTSGPNKGFSKKTICSVGSMDMFFFNNYRLSNFKGTISNNVKIYTSYQDINGNLKDDYSTGILYNADFEDFTIDGSLVKGVYYNTSGKGFMFNVFENCDWKNVVVQYTDATGFGVDCPINATMKNCTAIGNGKGGTNSSEGASGFGIGTGYRNDEYIVIEDSVALNNMKFGFFFEDQHRWSDNNYYPATTADAYVVQNSVAGGNLYDFGGLKAIETSYHNVTSVTGQSSYNGVTLTNSHNRYPYYFSKYSVNSSVVKSNFANNLQLSGHMETNYSTEIKWAVNNGFIEPDSATSYGGTNSYSRLNAMRTLYRYNGMPDSKMQSRTVTDVNTTLKIVTSNYNNFKDLFTISNNNPVAVDAYKYDLDAIKWGLNKGILSTDETFRPDDAVKRSEFITMLYRMAGNPNVTSTSMNFSDVSSGDWFYTPVAWGYNIGVIEGEPGGTFNPSGPMTKSTVAIMLYRYFNYVNESYSIKYNLNGGTASGNPSSYTYNSSFTLRNPTKAGYIFNGWTGSNGSSPSKNVSVSSGNRGDLIYTANWTKISLTSITASSSKTQYTVGDNLDMSKITVTAHYSDGSTDTIPTSSCTITPNSFNSTGTVSVNVKCYIFETSFNVTVSNAPVTLTSISAVNSKTTYRRGESLDISKVTITGHYSNGSNNNISPSSCTFNPTVFNSTGTQTVTVTCSGKSTTFEVTVIQELVTLSSISVTNTKNDYVVGDSLNLSYITIVGTYSNGTTNNISPSSCTFNPTSFSSAGTKTVTVTCSEVQGTFTVNVSNPPATLSSISVSNSKDTYYKGESLDKSKITVTGHYSDGSTNNISTNSCTFNPTTFNTVGNVTVAVTCSGKSTTFSVTVQDIVVTSISIYNLPKTSYVVGDSLDTSGLSIQATYNNGSTQIVSSGLTTNPNNGSTLDSPGSKTIEVSYSNKTTSYTITVANTGEPLLSLKSKPTKIKYKKGEKLNLSGLKLDYTDASGVTNTITEGYTSSIANNTVLNEIGSHIITITYQGLSVNFSISVYKLNSFTITGNYKTKYLVGDNISYDGLILNLSYSDGSTGTIESGYETSVPSGTELTKAGSQTITVTYEGISKSFDINVIDVSNISVKDGTIKLTYNKGDKLDLSKLVILVKYSDNTTEEINSGYTSSLEDGTVLGSKYDGYELTISYRGVTTKVKLNMNSVSESDDVPNTGSFTNIILIIIALFVGFKLFEIANKRIIKKV